MKKYIKKVLYIAKLCSYAVFTFSVIIMLLGIEFAYGQIRRSDDIEDISGNKINGDVYVLPKGQALWHGSENWTIDFSKESKFKSIPRATWFGVTPITSIAYRKSDKRKSGSCNVLYKVKFKEDLWLVIIKHKKEQDSHKTTLKDVLGMKDEEVGIPNLGYPPDENSMKVVNLIGETTVCIKDLDEGGSKGTIKRIIAWKRTGDKSWTPREKYKEEYKNINSNWAKECNQVIQLNGWRSPWDQDEVAVVNWALMKKIGTVEKLPMPVGENGWGLVKAKVTDVKCTVKVDTSLFNKWSTRVVKGDNINKCIGSRLKGTTFYDNCFIKSNDVWDHLCNLYGNDADFKMLCDKFKSCKEKGENCLTCPEFKD